MSPRSESVSVCFPLLCLLGQSVKLAVQDTVCGLGCRPPC